MKKTTLFNRDDNLAIVTYINLQNCMLIYSPSHEEFKYLLVISVF